jgi:hypothetical protein
LLNCRCFRFEVLEVHVRIRVELMIYDLTHLPPVSKNSMLVIFIAVEDQAPSRLQKGVYPSIATHPSSRHHNDRNYR